MTFLRPSLFFPLTTHSNVQYQLLMFYEPSTAKVKDLKEINEKKNN